MLKLLLHSADLVRMLLRPFLLHLHESGNLGLQHRKLCNQLFSASCRGVCCLLGTQLMHFVAQSGNLCLR